MKKITRKLEILILALRSSADFPFDAPISTLAELFDSGKYEVHNPYTGELLNPSDYVEEIDSLLHAESQTMAYDTKKSCLSGEASFLQNRQNECKCQVLERQRRNLLSLVCRMLQDCPEYRLRPSELATESVGDLSGLSQESRAYLYMRMEKEVLSRNSILDI